MVDARAAPPEGWLKTGDLNMHYLDWGGTGEPVVALHGLASSCHWYDIAIPHVRDSLRFIALDQRAHGKTDQPSTGYDWPTLAGDIIGALDQLGVQRAAVVGHSWEPSVALSVTVLMGMRSSYDDGRGRLVLLKLPFQTAALFGYRTQVMTLAMKSQRNWPKRWEGS